MDVMDHLEPTLGKKRSFTNLPPVKPKLLLAASGSEAATKFVSLCHSFTTWAEVKVVATKESLKFINQKGLPNGVLLFTDNDDWASWKKIGDEPLQVELLKWADIMVIAPLSADTLAKVAIGLCDNLLTCIVRGWNYQKPLIVAPAMNSVMWKSPFTQHHVDLMRKLGTLLVLPSVEDLACGDSANGSMAETSVINNTVMLSLEPRPQPQAIRC